MFHVEEVEVMEEKQTLTVAEKVVMKEIIAKKSVPYNAFSPSINSLIEKRWAVKDFIQNPRGAVVLTAEGIEVAKQNGFIS